MSTKSQQASKTFGLPMDCRTSFPWTGTSDISLRDYFAGQALNGILMNYTTERFGISEKSIADHAYKLADALLVSRERKGGSA